MLTYPTATKLADFDFSKSDEILINTHIEKMQALIEGATRGMVAHLLTTEAARHFDGENIESIRQTLTAHWMALFTEGMEDGGACRVSQLGIMGRDCGIPASVYVIGHGWMASHLSAEIMRWACDEPDRSADMVAAVLKLVFFDMSRAMHAWNVTLVD